MAIASWGRSVLKSREDGRAETHSGEGDNQPAAPKYRYCGAKKTVNKIYRKPAQINA